MEIATFRDGSQLEFASGRFDEWCIYLTTPRGERRAPRDVDYFTTMRRLASRYGNSKLYKDFIAVYDLTSRRLDSDVLHLIRRQSIHYRPDDLEFSLAFVTIYAGMIAEENKRHAPLGRRVKRLGMYQVLIENMLPEEAANYSKNMKWRAIAQQCERFGF